MKARMIKQKLKIKVSDNMTIEPLYIRAKYQKRCPRCDSDLCPTNIIGYCHSCMHKVNELKLKLHPKRVEKYK